MEPRYSVKEFRSLMESRGWTLISCNLTSAEYESRFPSEDGEAAMRLFLNNNRFVRARYSPVSSGPEVSFINVVSFMEDDETVTHAVDRAIGETEEILRKQALKRLDQADALVKAMGGMRSCSIG